MYDEILAYPVWYQQIPAFTATLDISYKRMIPLNTWQKFSSKIEKINGRKVYMSGRVYDGNNDSVVYNTGSGLWIESKYLDKIQNNNPNTVKQSKL